MDRTIVAELLARIVKPPPLLQIVVGPRQVGKSTAAHAVAARWKGPVTYAAADLPLPPGPEWIETQWQRARHNAKEGPALLILDEVQKVPRWSEVVKGLWDEDRASRRRVRTILLGSSALLLSKGANESLAGRFFLHRCLHWSFGECRRAFRWPLDRWIYFGGYPGAAPLVDEEGAWRRYVADSLVETVISRDVLGLTPIAKPALLRHLFALAARFPAQVLSYNKMLGQLQDAGNTTTLAHYVRVLETAFLVSGLERFSMGGSRSRGSSPKLIFWNNALVSALTTRSFEDARDEPEYWGRLVENAVGAHLLNSLAGPAFELTYWRDRADEVDFVVRTGRDVWGIEVKSGRPRPASGLEAFRSRHPRARALIVGSGGMPLEEFFLADPSTLFA